MGEVEAGRKENEGEENIKSMHFLFFGTTTRENRGRRFCPIGSHLPLFNFQARGNLVKFLVSLTNYNFVV